MTVNKNQLLQAVKCEMARSTGCTDPGAVCLAVSRAVRELGTQPEQIRVTVSANVYKNGVSVGIPGTGQRGLRMAAALGAVLDRSEAGLAVLDHVTDVKLAEATELLSGRAVQVGYEETPDPLYIKAEVFAGPDRACVVIANDYSNVVRVSRNGQVTFSAPVERAEEVQHALEGCRVRELFDLVETMTVEELAFLLEAAELNREAAQVGLTHPAMRLGPALAKQRSDLPPPFAAMHRAQVLTAAAGEARMVGLKVPIMAIVGSGNHGITNFLGLLAVAEELGSSREDLARALALGCAITVYIKGFVKRMTAFCGCTVAAAPGVAAGTAYLLGGSYDDAVHAMQSVVGTLAGLLCDGAKESCAYKLSAATATAIQSAYLALEGAHIPAGGGIVGNTIEETFENLGRLNNPGMVETDRFVLQLIEQVQAGRLA